MGIRFPSQFGAKTPGSKMGEFVIVVAWLAMPTTLFAQAEKNYTDTGKLPWIVTKTPLNIIGGEKIVADFATEQQAIAACKNLEASLNDIDQFRFTYVPSMRRTDDKIKKAKDLIGKVREAKQAYDRAGDIVSGDLKRVQLVSQHGLSCCIG